MAWRCVYLGFCVVQRTLYTDLSPSAANVLVQLSSSSFVSILFQTVETMQQLIRRSIDLLQWATPSHSSSSSSTAASSLDGLLNLLRALPPEMLIRPH